VKLPGPLTVGFALASEALWELAAADLTLALGNFAALRRRVGNEQLRSCSDDAFVVERVCRAVRIACVWYYKPVLCLQRSAVTARMLKRRGIDAHMVVGAMRVPLRAHAWVCVQDRIVDERPDVVAKFAVLDVC
jgi:hypothetical protein